MILSQLSKVKSKSKDLKGTCANCKNEVYESMWILDDCYNVWAGECPHCKAINLLALTGMRGYSSAGMDLVLPYLEEIEANELLKARMPIPNNGPSGKPADIHGTVAGEIAHQLLKP